MQMFFSKSTQGILYTCFFLLNDCSLQLKFICVCNLVRVSVCIFTCVSLCVCPYMCILVWALVFVYICQCISFYNLMSPWIRWCGIYLSLPLSSPSLSASLSPPHVLFYVISLESIILLYEIWDGCNCRRDPRSVKIISNRHAEDSLTGCLWSFLLNSDVRINVFIYSSGTFTGADVLSLQKQRDITISTFPTQYRVSTSPIQYRVGIPSYDCQRDSEKFNFICSL